MNDIMLGILFNIDINVTRWHDFKDISYSFSPNHIQLSLVMI